MKRPMTRYKPTLPPCSECGERIVGLWPKNLCYRCWLAAGRPR